MKTNIDRLIRLLNEIGCTEVSYRHTKHYTLYFSYQGQQAKPIFISSTPSAQNALKQIAGDIWRELKLLGGTPHQSNLLRTGFGVAVGCVSIPLTNPIEWLLAEVNNVRVTGAWHELAELAGEIDPSDRKVAPGAPTPCPFCGELLRTSQAKQCRFCRKDWHDGSQLGDANPEGN